MSKTIVPRQVPKVSTDRILQDQLEAQRDGEMVTEINVPEASPTQMTPPPVPSGGVMDPFSYEEVPPTQQEADMEDYYNKSIDLFKDDTSDGFTTNDINPNAAAYQDPMGEGRVFTDREGNPLPAEQLAAKRQEELSRQANTPNTVAQLMRAREAKDIVDAYPGAVQEGQANSTLALARDISLALANQKTTLPASQYGESQSSLSMLSDGLGTTSRSAGNLNALAITSTAGLLVRKKPISAKGSANFENFDDVEQSEDSDSVFSSLSALVSSDNEGAISLSSTPNGGSPRSAVESITGRVISALARNSRNAIDSQGRPIDPSTTRGMTMPSKVAGAMSVQAAIDSGYYESFDYEGIPHVRLTDKGMNYYMESKTLDLMLTNTLSGRAQKVPVSETGELIGGQRGVRGTDIKGFGYQPLDATAEVKRIYGSIGKLSSPTKGYFGLQMFKVLLQQIENGGDPVQGINAMKFFKIEPSELKTPVMLAKLNLAASEFFHQAGFMADGSPNFTRYKESYSTHRMYEDSVDFNEQRNKMTRAMMIYSSAGMQVNQTNFQNTGISASVANAHWEGVAAKARKKDFSFTSKERELNFLALLGRVLNVGKNAPVSKTENMTVPQMMSLVDSNFIKNAAGIGMQLASLVPNSTKEIVNEILAVVTKTDMQYNRGLKSQANIYQGNPSAISELFGKPLTEAQSNAVNSWINNSERDTWGYTLQAYLDAARYLKAKETGELFTPKTTIAIDMNSAGRAFLAMDIGNENILSRVGLLWQEFSDKEFQDVVGKGDPRSYFTEQAREKGIAAAFSDAEKQKTWKDALFKYGGPGAKNAKAFNSSFGKKVLLTTDYGKPIMFHLDEASAFLDENPQFRQEMLSKYNNDYKSLINDLNEVYHQTLRTADNAWQYSLPKKIVEYLQMFGRVPKPKGVYGEQISIGKTGPKDEGDYYRITSPKGGDVKVPVTRFGFDPRAKARDKRIRNVDGELIDPPGPGSAAKNQIGPVMGQYRESIVMMETAKYINQGKDSANMLNMSPVFDNYILDSDSYLMTLFVANNIIVPKVLEFNMVDSFLKDFDAQNAAAIKELREGPDNVVIDPDSKYQGVLDIYDTQYKYILSTPEADLRDDQKKIKEFIESPSSGYVPKENRAQTLIINKVKLANLILKMEDYRGVRKNLSKWRNASESQRIEALNKIKALARRNRIYFFT